MEAACRLQRLGGSGKLEEGAAAWRQRDRGGKGVFFFFFYYLFFYVVFFILIYLSDL